jgi:hypothetical protein
LLSSLNFSFTLKQYFIRKNNVLSIQYRANMQLPGNTCSGGFPGIWVHRTCQDAAYTYYVQTVQGHMPQVSSLKFVIFMMLLAISSVAIALTNEAAPASTPASTCSAPLPSGKPVVARIQPATNFATTLDSKDQSVAVYCGGNPSNERKEAAPQEGRVSPWLDFWSKVVIALSWPIVAAIAAWRLAPDLKEKMKDLTKVKAGPVEAEFAKEVNELRKEVEAVAPERQANRPVSGDEARLLELARVAPRSAVIEAWRSVELAATKAVEARIARRKLAPSSDARRSPLNTAMLGRELGFLQILNGQQMSIFHELRTLRNHAAHTEDFEIDFEAVNNYIQLAQSLIEILKTADAELRPE